jgi:hypothetical protein
MMLASFSAPHPVQTLLNALCQLEWICLLEGIRGLLEGEPLIRMSLPWQSPIDRLLEVECLYWLLLLCQDLLAGLLKLKLIAVLGSEVDHILALVAPRWALARRFVQRGIRLCIVKLFAGLSGLAKRYRRFQRLG